MRQKYLSLAIVILVVTLYKISIKITLFPQSQINVPPTVNAEAALAMGRKIALNDADIGDLIMIKFISDGIAKELVDRKEEILFKARRFPSSQKYKALIGIKGIAEKRAKFFSEFLELG